MKKCIVITSVSKPSRAVLEFLKTDYELILVGDSKTPPDFHDLDCVFLDLPAQRKLFPDFDRLLPLNSYARKNMGYAYALTHGYDIIAESDDDNIPLPGWGELKETADFSRTIVAPECPNIYSLYTEEHVWPRGFPLDKVRLKEEIKVEQRAGDVHIVQGLVNGDPDVDAIYRLTSPNAGKAMHFQNNGGYVLEKGVWSPFNSQNTLWLEKSAHPWLYLPATVSFRYTDILRSWVAQRAVWECGGRLSVAGASAFQERNPHDLMRDFRDEIPVYSDFYRVREALWNIEFRRDGEDPLRVWGALRKEGIVLEQELEIVAEWMRIAASRR